MKGIKNILKASGLFIIIIMLAIVMIIPSAAAPQSVTDKLKCPEIDAGNCPKTA